MPEEKNRNERQSKEKNSKPPKEKEEYHGRECGQDDPDLDVTIYD